MEDPKETPETFKTLFDTVNELMESEDADAELRGTAGPNEPALLALREWLEAGGGFVHPDLVFGPVGDAGTGCLAKRDIAAGVELFRVPLSRVITEQTALADAAVEKMSAQLTLLRQFPSALLAFFLLIERLRARRSPWQPYLDVLPRTYSVPLFWTWPELLLLRGSPAFAQAHQMFKLALRLYLVVQRLCEGAAVQQQQQQPPPKQTQQQQRKPVAPQPLNAPLGLGRAPTYAHWRWALSAVFTRRNFVPGPGGTGTSLALIPGWDMCNHQTGHLTTSFDTTHNAVSCTAMAATASGGEVCIFYGPRSNLDLLVHNGFLPSDADHNRHDYFPLRLSLNPNDPLHEVKKQLLLRVKLAPTINYAAQREFGPSSQGLVFGRVARLTAADVEGGTDTLDPLKMISAANGA